MCATCGCADGARPSLTDLGTGQVTSLGEPVHEHDHAHPHDHPHPETRTIVLEQEVLSKNNLLAERNRDWFARAPDRRAEPDELARRRQDHAAGADDP